MSRAHTFLRIFTLAVLSLAVAGGAQAGYWSVVYDMTGSDLETVNPGGTFNDPITGTITIEYPAVSSGAALTAGRLAGGTLNGTIDQNAGILHVTGSNTNTLNPGLYPASGPITGAQLNLPVVAQHALKGSLHCTSITTGNCTGAFGGVPASTPIPQSASGTFPLPPMNFTGSTGGVGDWTSPTQTVTTTGPLAVVLKTTYVGAEVSRTWVENDLPVPLFGAVGTFAVFGGLLATGYGVTRRRAS